VSGSTVYAGGEFDSIGGRPRNYIAALDAASGAATAWNPNPNLEGYVWSLAVSGSTIYAGGRFTNIGGQPRNFVAALDAASGAATAWDPNANRFVYALGVSGSTVYAGGDFKFIGGHYQPHVAAIPADQTVSVGGDRSVMEDALTVAPNPTQASMQIRYAVVRAGRVRLELLDVSGRVVETLADRIQAPGRYVAAWDGAGRRGRLSSGLYFVRLMAPGQMAVRKLAIIR
jgi:hypothetical protein